MSKAGVGTQRKVKAVPFHFRKKEEEAARFECPHAHVLSLSIIY